MIELVIDPALTNKLGIKANENTVNSFLSLMIDLYQGKVITLGEDFLYDKDLRFDTTGYMHGGADEDFREYVVVELPAFKDLATKENFKELTAFLESYIPVPYKEVLSLAITPELLSGLFARKTLVMFAFHGGTLQCMSTFPYFPYFEEYIDKTSLRRKNLTKGMLEDLKRLFSSNEIQTNINTSYIGYGSYYSSRPNSNNTNLNMFIRDGYVRINALEIMDNAFSLVSTRNLFKGSFKSSESVSTLLALLVTPEAIPQTASKAVIGSYLLNMTSGANIGLTKQVFPVVVNTWGDFTIPESTGFLDIKLSNDDAEFLAKVREIDPADVYSKHKTIMAEQDATTTRGTIDLYNAAKSLKVVVRESKKRLSDEAAYRNRILKDYLNHAISLVCIPLFQKEFIIPEYLKNSFKFEMVNLESVCYFKYKYSGRPKLAYDENYGAMFRNPTADAAFVMPCTDFSTAVTLKPEQVKLFVKWFKSMELVSTTQSRSSIFTRHFVEPYIEKNTNYYSKLKTAAPFGWMYEIDNQEQLTWNYKMASGHLLRSSASRGRFYVDCGLLSEKTFGIKAIMNHVFILPEFSGIHTKYSSADPSQFVQEGKKAQCISAMLDIYTANFVPRDAVEDAMKAYGFMDYGNQIAQINQLLFLSDESLTMLKALYKCQSFEDLATCLDFCMPACMAILDTLDYSQELKDHLYTTFLYFWDTTKAISEEMESYDKTEE
jgi:hypothetical protein